jgi:ribose 5-phosphate isomerase RpiB
MKPAEQTDEGKVLHWPGKLLSADDLRRHLTSQSAVIVQRHTIVTPLVIDELRAKKVRLVRADDVRAGSVSDGPQPGAFGVAQEKATGVVDSVIQSLRRDGVTLTSMQECRESPASWAKSLAGTVAQGECGRLTVFCSDPGLVCCVANKLPGIRAVTVSSALQTVRASSGLAANVFAVEMPGRTFFEARQILLNVSKAATTCPTEVAHILRELDGHAHR